jgi:hypothetical protein
MDSGNLISRHLLPNGLTLELWDQSRPVAGNRWYTCLETRIIIPVRPNLPPELKPRADQVVEALGEEVIFSRQEERNFIAASEFPAIFQDMQDRMLELAPGYFGHRDFAAKYIGKTYAASKEQPQS